MSIYHMCSLDGCCHHQGKTNTCCFLAPHHFWYACVLEIYIYLVYFLSILVWILHYKISLRRMVAYNLEEMKPPLLLEDTNIAVVLWRIQHVKEQQTYP